MDLLAISINHRTAPVELREALHLNQDEIRAYLLELKDSLLSEGFIISTCNRTEIYGLPRHDKIEFADLRKFLTQKRSIQEIKDDHFQQFFSSAAVNHIFRVAAGIDSLLVGDNQIFGQVKESFQIAEDQQLTGPLLKRLFDAAIRVGKRAKTETLISEGAITVSYAAVQFVEKIFSLSKKSALVIGLGESGEIAAKHLRDKGIGKLTLTNRTASKAEQLGELLQAKVVPFESFKTQLHDYDIIISATAAPDIILGKNDVQVMMKKRGHSPAVFMDIAVPRDIDPDIRKIDGVFYNDIDSLSVIVEQNMKKRLEEIPKVEAIIEEETTAFFAWLSSLEVAPTIKSLRDLFEQVRADEVKGQINRFAESDREKIDILTKRIINKLLHIPTIELRKAAENDSDSTETMEMIAIIREMFGLDKKDNE